MPPPSEHSGCGRWWSGGLSDWVGVSIVTSEFVTRPEKKRQTQKRVHTHSPWLFFFEAVDFSVASKKRKDCLFFQPPVFCSPLALERFISTFKSCVSNFVVFFSTVAFQPWQFFQPHGMGNGRAFFFFFSNLVIFSNQRPQTPES